jgi:hypothetical protein
MLENLVDGFIASEDAMATIGDAAQCEIGRR